jgi:hypothetical protein
MNLQFLAEYFAEDDDGDDAEDCKIDNAKSCIIDIELY